MRPRGEVRQALAAAVERLYAEHGAVSPRQIAEAAQVGFEVARLTLKDMARSTRAEVVRVGSISEAGSKCWNALYEPRVVCVPDDETPQPWGGIEALANVMRSFPAPAADD